MLRRGQDKGRDPDGYDIYALQGIEGVLEGTSNARVIMAVQRFARSQTKPDVDDKSVNNDTDDGARPSRSGAGSLEDLGKGLHGRWSRREIAARWKRSSGTAGCWAEP